MINKPIPGQEDYGLSYSSEKAIIMEKTLGKLAGEFLRNNYGTYPFGFYKEVILSGSKYEEMKEIVLGLTGLTEEELSNSVKNFYNNNNSIYQSMSLTPSKQIEYESFLRYMKKADKILGGGSSYSETFMLSNAIIPMSYETALEEYNQMIEKDELTKAYARLFCDYMGIMLAILPMFLVVTRGLRDKRAQAKDLIFSRSASSFSIILSRYVSVITMILIPTILLTLFPTIECIYYGTQLGTKVDYLAFLKYSMGWLLPTIMVTSSLGFLLTELTETAIAIIVQGLWWIISLFSGVGNLVGGYGWNLLPRHNSLGGYQIFHDNFQILVRNRIFYFLFALVLIIITISIYEWKRKGILHVRGKILPNRKNKSKI